MIERVTIDLLPVRIFMADDSAEINEKTFKSHVNPIECWYTYVVLSTKTYHKVGSIYYVGKFNWVYFMTILTWRDSDL